MLARSLSQESKVKILNLPTRIAVANLKGGWICVSEWICGSVWKGGGDCSGQLHATSCGRTRSLRCSLPFIRILCEQRLWNTAFNQRCGFCYSIKTRIGQGLSEE